MQRLQRLIFEISFEIKSFVNRYITIAFTILFHCLYCSHLYEPNGAAQQFNNKNSKKISTTIANSSSGETRQYHTQHSCQWWQCHNNSGKKEVIVKKTHHNFTFLVWIYIFFASILLCSAFTIFFFGRSGWIHVSLRTQSAYLYTQLHKSRTY